MSDSVTKTSNISYGRNIKNSLGGAVIGLILFILSFCLLWWNEGRSAAQIEKANYINKNAVAVSSDKVDRQNDNALISTSGKAVTTETLSDDIISIPNALALKRNVEMYQWEEDEETTKKDNLGGSTTVTTTYKYKKVWSNNEINSDNFEEKSHVNPKFDLESMRVDAKSGNLGDYKITEKQTASIGGLEEYKNLPFNYRYKIENGVYYKGKDINNPEIGDIKISYTYAPSETDISIIGKQMSDNTITGFQMKKGNIYVQYNGILTQDEMVSKFKSQNSFITNVLRVVGFLMMFFGLNLIIDPIITILKFIPFVAGIASFFTTGIVFLVSLILSLLTIAIAWFANRPLVSIGLILLIAGISYLIIQKIKSKKAEEIKPDAVEGGEN